MGVKIKRFKHQDYNKKTGYRDNMNGVDNVFSRLRNKNFPSLTTFSLSQFHLSLELHGIADWLPQLTNAKIENKWYDCYKIDMISWRKNGILSKKKVDKFYEWLKKQPYYNDILLENNTIPHEYYNEALGKECITDYYWAYKAFEKIKNDYRDKCTGNYVEEKFRIY